MLGSMSSDMKSRLGFVESYISIYGLPCMTGLV